MITTVTTVTVATSAMITISFKTTITTAVTMAPTYIFALIPNSASATAPAAICTSNFAAASLPLQDSITSECLFFPLQTLHQCCSPPPYLEPWWCTSIYMSWGLLGVGNQQFQPIQNSAWRFSAPPAGWGWEWFGLLVWMMLLWWAGPLKSGT